METIRWKTDQIQYLTPVKWVIFWSAQLWNLSIWQIYMITFSSRKIATERASSGPFVHSRIFFAPVHAANYFFTINQNIIRSSTNASISTKNTKTIFKNEGRKEDNLATWNHAFSHGEPFPAVMHSKAEKRNIRLLRTHHIRDKYIACTTHWKIKTRKPTKTKDLRWILLATVK